MDLSAWSERVDPIVHREVGRAVRGRFALYVTGLAAVLALVLYASWPQSYAGLYYGRAYAVSPWQTSGQLLYQLVLVSALALLVLVPALSFDSVTGERAARTLDLLVASPLTPRQLVRGKALSSALVGAALVSATLPFVAALHLLGGIPLYLLALCYGGLALMVWLLASLGVALSAISAKAWQSALATALAVPVLAVLATGLGVALDGILGGGTGSGFFERSVRLLAGGGSYPGSLVALALASALAGWAWARPWGAAAARVAFAALLAIAVVADFPDLGIEGGGPVSSDPSELVAGVLFFLVIAAFFVLAQALSALALDLILVGAGAHARVFLPLSLALLALEAAGLGDLVLSRFGGFTGYRRGLPPLALFAACALGLSAALLRWAEGAVEERGWWTGEE